MFTYRVTSVNLENKIMTATCFAESADCAETVVATFGSASLFQKPEGGYALSGGSFDDRAEAKEWISLFLHEAVISDDGGSSWDCVPMRGA